MSMAKVTASNNENALVIFYHLFHLTVSLQSAVAKLGMDACTTFSWSMLTSFSLSAATNRARGMTPAAKSNQSRVRLIPFENGSTSVTDRSCAKWLIYQLFEAPEKIKSKFVIFISQTRITARLILKLKILKKNKQCKNSC